MHDPLNEAAVYVAYERDYVETLQSFEFSTLEGAMEKVREEWTSNTWPPVGFIAKAAKIVEQERREYQGGGKPAIPYFNAPSRVPREERLRVAERCRDLVGLLRSGQDF